MKKKFFYQSAPQSAPQSASSSSKSGAIDMNGLSPTHHKSNNGDYSVPLELYQFAKDRRRQRSVSTNTELPVKDQDQDQRLTHEDDVFSMFIG